MKNSILLIVVTLCMSFNSKPEETRGLFLPWTLEKSEKDTTLGSRQALYTFNFSGITIEQKSYHFIYSIDGIEREADLNADLSLNITTTHGKHTFQFFYTDRYTEVTISDLKIKPQFHDTYSVRLEDTEFPIVVDKPVIYLYPETETAVDVRVGIKGNNPFFYPAYNEGWKCIATPSGDLKMNGGAYNYLFWESNHTAPIIKAPSTGFAVKNADLVSFFESHLAQFGLTTKEQADFITYWAPQMIRYPACKIHFLLNEECNQFAELDIHPKPDNVYRFYMLWTPIENINDFDYLRPQKVQSISRLGFTVIEWGGAQISINPKEVL